MAIRRNYCRFVLLSVLAFPSCHHQKELTKDNNSANAVAIPKTLPGGTPAMSPGTFGAEAEVISVTKIQDSIAHQDYYVANMLIHAITGRGSSLIAIVSADDTINCTWQAYHADDKQLADDIAKKKLMETVIREMIGRGPESSVAFIIQSYRFK